MVAFQHLHYRCCVLEQVYMSSSGLNWSPIFEAWLMKREHRAAAILRKLIETWFFQTYDFARQNLQFKMPILECNVVFQVFISHFLIITRLTNLKRAILL